jgi:hypothetical protein
MNKRKLLVYLDPGFLENRGHYMNFSMHVHAEATRRDIDVMHFVNTGTSREYCDANGLIPVFSRTAYVSDTSPETEVAAIAEAISQGFSKAVSQVSVVSRKYDEIVYYMYTGHPTYVWLLARHLLGQSHGDAVVSACVVLFYLSDKFCFDEDDGRYGSFLRRVSNRLEKLDDEGVINVGIDSDTALDRHAGFFSRPVKVIPFPHVQRADPPKFPSKPSELLSRPRVTYSGYPHSKYGFHLVVGLIEQSLSDPLWANVDFEIKLNSRLKEDDLFERWKELAKRVPNLSIHEGYMDDVDYLAMIGRADVLLIPYNSQYNHDTSAVLVDGLLNGCIVVAAEPTWMANVCLQHGSCRTYTPEDQASFNAAANDVIRNFNSYKARTTLNIEEMPRKFSAEGLFDELFPTESKARRLIKSKNSLSIDEGNEVILQPPMSGVYPFREMEMSQQQLKEELASLEGQLGELPNERLPGKNVDLPQKVYELRLIAQAWERKSLYKSRFKAFSASHKTVSCVVLGPDVALDPQTILALKDSVIFSPQQTYRQFKEMAVKPTYMVLESESFVRNNLDDIKAFPAKGKFAPFFCAHILGDDESVVYFNHQPRKSYPDGYDVSLVADEVTYTSCTAVGTALQVAMSMGFKEVYVLGVDVREGNEEYEELKKFYGEAEKTAAGDGIRLVNVCINTSVPSVPFVQLEPFWTAQKRAHSVLAAAASGGLDHDWSPEDIVMAERALLNKHPCPSDIYLPTTKYQGIERIAAIRKVVTAWNDRRDLHKARLREARRRVQGRDRCFIIGNGPSLNQTNLDLLGNEVTFATNGIFLKFDESKFRPTFFVVEDHLVGEDRYREINELKGFTKLSPYYLSYCLEDGEDVIYYNHQSRISYPQGFDFSTNAEEITYTGCTVTFSCMQLAYYMGFKEIYLIGVDMSYVVPDAVKKANEYDTEILDMDFDDPNHFAPNYFGRGYRWHDPNVDKMEQAYIEARKITELNGVKIYNATIGGKCEVFDRVDYYSLFGESAVARLKPASNPEIRGGSNGKSVEPQGALSLYSLPKEFYSSERLNKLVSHAAPLSVALKVGRNTPSILVAEVGGRPAESLLSSFYIEIDGVRFSHTLYIEQFPIVIKAEIPARPERADIQVNFLLAEDDGARGAALCIESVHVIPDRTLIKKPFPFSHFDGIRYLKENPDVADAVAERRCLSGLSHYSIEGAKQGRRFTFAISSRPNHGYRYELKKI